MDLSVIWKKKLHGNRHVIAKGEAECNLPVVSVIFIKLHSKTCGYLLIIRHLANKNWYCVR